MDPITFELQSYWKFKLEMVKYPELISRKKWIQKGIDLLKKHAPKVLGYLSREKILSDLNQHPIIIEVPPQTQQRKKRYKGNKRDLRVQGVFSIWLKKEKAKRLFFVILEALVIPFTPILALLPGPNVFFYIPALLLFYHYTAYRGLRKVHVPNLKMEIQYQTSSLDFKKQP